MFQLLAAETPEAAVDAVADGDCFDVGDDYDEFVELGKKRSFGGGDVAVAAIGEYCLHVDEVTSDFVGIVFEMMNVLTRMCETID